MIADNKLKKCFPLLKEHLEDTSTVILLELRYKRNERNQLMGIIENREYNVTNNQITYAVLEMLDEI